MSRLSLDDFVWEEQGFDLWMLEHREYDMAIAAIHNFNGWHVKVLHDPSMKAPLHVDSLDAAKALAAITAAPYMEQYHGELNNYIRRRRPKTDGPPAFRPGVFKLD